MKKVVDMNEEERNSFRFEILNQEEKEQIIKEYYSWLFSIPEEKVTLYREVEEVLAPTYEDPFIYQHPLIERLSKTKAMLRTKNITQQGLQFMADGTNIYNRYSHGLGTAYLALEENIMLWIQNPLYCKIVENNDLKLKVFCIEIAELTHDMGHQILSHLIEYRFLGKVGVHEEIGKRILLEDEEINQVILNFEIDLVLMSGPNAITFNKYQDDKKEKIIAIINEDLDDENKKEKLKKIITESVIKKELKEVLEKGVLNSKEHTEGNMDVDRKDYMRRNYFHHGTLKKYEYPMYKRYFFEVDKNGEFVIDENGQRKLATEKTPLERIRIIDAYKDEDFEKVEQFLIDRMDNYENVAWAAPTQAREIVAGKFFEVVAESNEPRAIGLTNFFKYLRETSVDEYDLNRLIEADEIKMYLDMIDIAQNADSNYLRTMAKLNIPELNVLMYMIADRLDIQQARKEGFCRLNEFEKKIIKKIYEFIKGDTDLAKDIRDGNMIQKNIMIIAGADKIDKVQELYSNIFGNIIRFKLTGYNAKNPIMFEGKNGELIPLEEHPRRKIEWGKIYNKTIEYTCAIIPELRREGNDEEYIEKVRDDIKDYLSPTEFPKGDFNPRGLSVDSIYKLPDLFRKESKEEEKVKLLTELFSGNPDTERAYELQKEIENR